MSIELITAALLTAPGVTSIVGGRRALSQLPQNMSMPALVYNAVSTVPEYTMNAGDGLEKQISRVQVTALADSSDGVQALLTAVKTAMNLKHGTYAGIYVGKIEFALRTQIAKDNEAGVWYASQDFIVHWYE